MKKNILKTNLVIYILTCSIIFTACNNTTVDEDTASSNNITEDVTQESTSDLVEQSKEFFVESGYYTIGVDIPAGICDINIASGTGSILYSEDGTIETHSPVDGHLNQPLISNDSEYGSIQDYVFQEGYVIHISGSLRLHLKYSQLTSSYSSRKYDEQNAFTLKAGEYVVGRDFEAGIYTIVATEGVGSIYSSNAFELGVYEDFGIIGSANCAHTATNITLNDGDTLEVTDVTIELIKAK